MRAIHRKLLRDLWALRSQVITVALVIASAFSGFAGSIATYLALERARDDFYATAHFADVFADVKRAPRSVLARIAAIPGVDATEATAVFDVRLDLPGVIEPVIGRLVGWAPDGGSGLNQLVLRRGRLPQANEPAEVVVSEGFSTVRRIGPGDAITALVNGRQRSLRIVGVGLSPEYIYATQGGAFPDDRNFGVLWMDRRQLAAAYDMEGGFNHVSVRLAADSDERAVIDALDRAAGALRRTGGARPRRAAFASHPERGDRPVEGDRDGAPLDLPRRCSLPPERGSVAPGHDATRADRRIESAGLRQRRHRAALPAAGGRGRRSGGGDRHRRRDLVRKRRDRAVRGILPLSVVPVHAPLERGRGGGRNHRSGGGARCAGCRARRGAPRPGGSDAPAVSGSLPALRCSSAWACGGSPPRCA